VVSWLLSVTKQQIKSQELLRALYFLHEDYFEKLELVSFLVYFGSNRSKWLVSPEWRTRRKYVTNEWCNYYFVCFIREPTPPNEIFTLTTSFHSDPTSDMRRTLALSIHVWRVVTLQWRFVVVANRSHEAPPHSTNDALNKAGNTVLWTLNITWPARALRYSIIAPDIHLPLQKRKFKLIAVWPSLGMIILQSTAGLHNSESSKGQIDQHKFPAGCKSLFRHRVEEILKGQVIIRSRAFATFSATEFSRAACGPRAVCCAGLVYSVL